MSKIKLKKNIKKSMTWKNEGQFILWLRRVKLINYPRKEYKKKEDFLLFGSTTINKGEREENFKFSPKFLEKLRENQGIYGEIERNTYI